MIRSLPAATLLMLNLALPALAQVPATTPPATPPTATPPTTAPAAPAASPTTTPTISPDAQQLLDSLRTAYLNLGPATFSGTVGADIDVAGQKQAESKPFTATFLPDGLKFRHETPGEILIGSTGEKLYAFRPAAKGYVQGDAFTAKVAAADIAQPYQMILRTQNPSLLLALSTDPAEELTRNAKAVTRAPDLTLSGTAYPALSLESADGTLVTVALDPATHLLRHVTFDLRKVAESRGAPDVKKALLINDYATTTLGQPAPAESFAWAPPEGAVDESAPRPPVVAENAAVLENKPAPDFTLKGEDDKDLKLSTLKGSVVILDFWATWCPPCREGLPVLDTLAKDFAAKGVKVYAVNVREEKPDVLKFKENTSLGLPVLFDAEGKVSDLYKVTGIPQTVVIAKDGTVKKVIIGYSPEEKATLEKLLTELAANP